VFCVTFASIGCALPPLKVPLITLLGLATRLVDM
jgi:hypothetical protein